tara:strand:- start:186 stop:497 length:312 start_codon:yes stop_codon:yes gene_type:complete
MKFYHTCPEEYIDKQYSSELGWTPYYGSTWLAETPRESFQGSQTKAERKVIVGFELELDQVEDHSSMPICKRLGRNYYMHRGTIPLTNVWIEDTVTVKVKVKV